MYTDARALKDQDLSSCLQANSSETIAKRLGVLFVSVNRKGGVLAPSPFTSAQNSRESASGRSTQRPDIGFLHGIGAASSLCARLFSREERFLHDLWCNRFRRTHGEKLANEFGSENVASLSKLAKLETLLQQEKKILSVDAAGTLTRCHLQPCDLWLVRTSVFCVLVLAQLAG